uniref:AB hydrolase-1 domain-containing protein n=1 Tax=Oncorhynchus tshawytscha TaxID=74940 RepID=A0A8C8D731_ONCTS
MMIICVCRVGIHCYNVHNRNSLCRTNMLLTWRIRNHVSSIRGISICKVRECLTERGQNLHWFESSRQELHFPRTTGLYFDTKLADGRIDTASCGTATSIDVHYVHVRPKNLPEGVTAVPLLMVHGWPGSFYEFYRMIPLLTQPSNPDDIVFEVVCPSIPGYGFSEAPHKKGFDSVCAARVFHKLMKRLGFQQFYAHGGDWGWIVTTNMAQLEPKIIKGLHLNFAPPSKPGLPVVLSIMLGRSFPKLFGFNEHDIQRIYPVVQNLVVESVKESGYMHIQATKPDTVGRALNDSPVGLAAYILEKFSTWTDHDFRNLDDGGLTRKFSLDDLLTNVMIYWTSGCIISSMRFYKENFSKGLDQPHSKMPVHVPTGFACFPNELMHTPKLWVQQKYRELKTFTPMARGGHFAAMEEPELMAQDIQNFTKMQEKMK